MATVNMHTNPVFQLTHVQFDDDRLSIIEMGNKYFAVLKPICSFLDLDWEAQRQLIIRELVLSSVISIIKTVAQDEKQREMVCLPLEYLNGWLFKINPIRYEGDRRKKIIRYQKECYKALFNHFFSRKHLK